MNTVRTLVSKKKKRYQKDGFDLDLSDITPRIIAMGYPSTGYEAAFRNPLSEVQRFFNSKYIGHYKIYNLCSERAYDLAGSFEKVDRFPFDDHNPCALKLIEKFCQSCDAYLAEHPQNVVGIHCKAGKGRTGQMIACYLLHSGVCMTAEDALETFAKQRTTNGKGVTIPSQVRYVHYYEQMLRRDDVIAYTYQITHIRFLTVPNFDPAIAGGGCDPYVVVRLLVQESDVIWKERLVFHQSKAYQGVGRKIRKCHPSERFVDIDLEAFHVKVRGDIKLVFYDKDQYSDDKMFHLWFHTAFVERNYLMFEKPVIDKACKDKRHRSFDKDFRVEIYLHRVDDGEFDAQALGEEDEDITSNPDGANNDANRDAGDDGDDAQRDSEGEG